MRFLFLCLLLSPTAYASEAMFGYLYTTDTTPAKSWEYEQKQTLRTGKARGSYTALDLRNEFEYGVTDKFQASLYVNSTYMNTKNQYDPENVSQNLPDHNEFNVNGTSVELVYRLLSPYTDGFGLAAYLEPEISVRDHMTGGDMIERALEWRLILQKNFFDDQLLFATNLMLEPEWEKEDGHTMKELWVEWTLGSSYRIRSNWFVGLEFRNHMEFPDMNLGNQEHSAYFLGPNIHYGGEKFWATLTVLPQISGYPRLLGTGSDGKQITSDKLHLGQHEKLEIRLAFGVPL